MGSPARGQCVVRLNIKEFFWQFFHPLMIKVFRILYYFPDAHEILVATPLIYALPVDTPPVLNATHETYAVLPQRNHMLPVLEIVNAAYMAYQSDLPVNIQS